MSLNSTLVNDVQHVKFLIELEGERQRQGSNSSRGENLVTVTGYWLKPVTVTEVTGWPKSPTHFGNRVAV